MKTRTSFVANSSSASFILRIYDITEDELLKIVNDAGGWGSIGYKTLKEFSDNEKIFVSVKTKDPNWEKGIKWGIELEGITSMCNDYSDIPDMLKDIMVECIKEGMGNKLEFRIEED
jgi:hypothetical protein